MSQTLSPQPARLTDALLKPLDESSSAMYSRSLARSFRGSCMKTACRFLLRDLASQGSPKLRSPLQIYVCRIEYEPIGAQV
jgi:hypothetical protein